MKGHTASGDSPQEGKRGRRKPSWHFLAAVAAIVIVAMALTDYFGRRVEYACEMSDLQAMRNAEACLRLLWKDKLPETAAEYWYDGEAMQVIPFSEPAPACCGMGTRKRGGATGDFAAETGESYDYSENMDYTNMTVHATVDSREGSLEIHLDWLPGRETITHEKED